MPILLYATTGVSLTREQINELNVCWNFVYRRILNYNKWESVNSLISCSGRFNLKYIRSLLCVKFYKHGLNSHNIVFTTLIKRFFLSSDFLHLCTHVGLVNPSYDSFKNKISVNYLKYIVYKTFGD